MGSAFRRLLLAILRIAPLLVIVPALVQTRPVQTAILTAPAAPTASPAASSSVTPTRPPATPTIAPPTPRADTYYLYGYEAPYIPILMYHYIRTVDADADPLGFKLSIRPDRFEEQLAWLREQGYTGLRMRELAACLRAAAGCPPRSVALTFDDGYADNAAIALPLLKRYRFPATFYIATGFIGRDGYMSWEDLELLRDSGMELGAHTVSHADLAALDLDTARREIVGSRDALRERLGITVASFSYPAGSYTPEVARLVKEAGFTSAVTVAPGDRLEHLYALQRRRVIGGETIEGYRWYMAPPSLLEQ